VYAHAADMRRGLGMHQTATSTIHAHTWGRSVGRSVVPNVRASNDERARTIVTIADRDTITVVDALL
jgi:hypothetical protein